MTRHDSGPEITPAGPDRGIDAGHVLDATLAVAAVGIGAAHLMREKWPHVQEAMHRLSDTLSMVWHQREVQ